MVSQEEIYNAMEKGLNSLDGQITKTDAVSASESLMECYEFYSDEEDDE